MESRKVEVVYVAIEIEGLDERENKFLSNILLAARLRPYISSISFSKRDKTLANNIIKKIGKEVRKNENSL